ncbi:hypothetical protein [Streptomyces sp. NPDC091212]|uniref:hypothetical protein n=1 Tax=Streptomyces sp. NPDC091212 TaxID=3155191 RepID=UPI00341DC569
MGEWCGSGPTVEEEEEEAAFQRMRDERIESLYQGCGAREMAERIVDLEDELGADVDGICTGMHADVAEAHCEIERLTALLATRIADNTAEWTAVRSIQLMNEAGRQRDRYRLAWRSARRRAAEEHNLAIEALDLRDEEIERLTRALRLSEAKVGRLRVFVDEVQRIRGWSMCASTARDLMESHLRPVYDALYELEDAEREGRRCRDRWTRTGHESMADMCPRCQMIQDGLPQPTPCTCDDEAATVAYWKAELERTHQEEVCKSTCEAP